MFNQTRHGKVNSYNKGCRCNLCKEAKKLFRKNGDIKTHGTKWSYDKGCRCEECKKTKSVYTKKYHPNDKVITTDMKNMTRICYACKEKKDLEDFVKSNNKRSSLGRGHECKDCHNEASKRNKNKPNARYSTYKSGAKVRDIDFDLTLEVFKTYWNKPCFYCGSEIDGIGLDRIDPSVGYNVKNIVPCCKTCNRAKTVQGGNEFIALCKKISARFEHSDVFPIL